MIITAKICTKIFAKRLGKKFQLIMFIVFYIDMDGRKQGQEKSRYKKQDAR
ncbi:MAG: hypothetical protein GXO71_01690 [Caldiserica bacterium]|nr:hypothetical protein [Caldisericota bacterium]